MLKIIEWSVDQMRISGYLVCIGYGSMSEKCHGEATSCGIPKEDAYGTERQEKKLSQQWQQGIQK